jgi:MFS family permease
MIADEAQSSAGAGIAYRLSSGRRHLLVAVMMSGHISQGVIFSSVPPLLGSISQSFGGGTSGEFMSQMTMSMPAFGLMGGGLASGWILGRTGIRRLLILSLIGLGVFGAAPVFLHDAVSLLGGRMLTGFASACLTTACASLVVESLQGADRARVVGYQSAWGPAVALLSIYAAGFAVERVHWQTTFLLYAALAAVFLVAALASIPPTPVLRHDGDRASRWTALGPVWWILATAPAVYIVGFLANTQLPFLLRQNGISSPAVHTIVISMFIVATTIASTTYATVRRTVGARNVLPLGLMLLGAGLMLIGFTHSLVSAGAGAALCGLYMGLALPYLWHAMMERAPAAVRSFALGLLSTAMYLGAFLNPFIMTGLQRALGMRLVFITVGAGALATLAITLAARRSRPERRP